MDAKLKSEWLVALRSGKYLQARGKLRIGKDGFCCLGVLCKVAKIPIAKDGAQCARGKDYSPIYRAVGMSSAHELMAMNDRAGKTFSEIADYIEQTI